MTVTMLLDGVPVPLPAGLHMPAAPPPATRYVPVATARERLEAAGLWSTLVGALDPAAVLKLATLRDGLDAADPQVRGLLSAIGADPDAILAP